VARGSNSKLASLKAVPLFAGLKKADLAAVAQIADELDLPAGKTLIAEGDVGRQFFVLLEGIVVVRRKGRKLRELGAGDFFGEIALLSDRPTTATVTTLVPARVAVITRTNFGRLLRDSPSVQWSVVNALAERVPDD
jgi:CRP-like cAMP-binding protein